MRVNAEAFQLEFINATFIKVPLKLNKKNRKLKLDKNIQNKD